MISAQGNSHRFSRGKVLKGMGASLSLPYFASADEQYKQTEKRFKTRPKSLIVSAFNFGMHPEGFHPKQAGQDYQMPEVLSALKPIKEKMTVFSNLDHGLKGGHSAQQALLSGVLLDRAKGYPDGNISLDQRLGELLSGQTRYAVMNIGPTGRSGVGWNRIGLAVPPIKSPEEAFQKLFVEDSKESILKQTQLRAQGKSVLDAVSIAAKDLSKRLNQQDHQRLDQFFTALRDTEKRLNLEGKWPTVPKAKSPAGDLNFSPKTEEDKIDLWYEVAYLSVMTDSCRVVTLMPDYNTTAVEGVTQGHHSLSHHGRSPERLSQLHKFERFALKRFGKFVTKVENTLNDRQETMGNQVMTLFGSGMGDGNRHTNDNLPLILAGGGYKHGQHIDAKNKFPLNRLYLSMLHQFGFEMEQFNGCHSTLGELV